MKNTGSVGSVETWEIRGYDDSAVKFEGLGYKPPTLK